jgi:hypothetical protein
VEGVLGNAVTDKKKVIWWCAMLIIIILAVLYLNACTLMQRQQKSTLLYSDGCVLWMEQVSSTQANKSLKELSLSEGCLVESDIERD